MASKTENVPVNTVIGVLLDDGETLDSLDMDFKTQENVDFDAKKNDAEASNVQKGSSKSRKSTPLAKREAIAQGLDIASIEGTGPRGKVTKSDVVAVQNIDGLEASSSELKASEKRFF